MHKYTILIVSLFLLAISPIFSQPCTGKTIADIDVSRQRIVRAYYDNDYFIGRDQYYTRGVGLELINPQFKNLFLSKNFLLRIGSRARTYYGLGVKHALYTPEDLQSADIVTGDRPYAGTFVFNHFLISNDLVRQMRMTTQIEVGFLGPLAGGGLIVRRTENPNSPKGWSNQIKTDLILGYKMLFEKGFVSTNGIDVVGHVSTNISTRYTYLGLGGLLRLGMVNPYFYELHFTGRSMYGSRSIKASQIYFYARPEIHFIGYDATLQGGLFNRSSPYTIPGSSIKRLRPKIEAGLDFTIHRVGLGLSYNWQGAEFKEGNAHSWGKIKVLFGF